MSNSGKSDSETVTATRSPKATLNAQSLSEKIGILYDGSKLGEALLLSDVLCKANDSRANQTQRLVLQIIRSGREKEYEKVSGSIWGNQ